MTRTIIIWICLALAALVAGPIAGEITGSLRALDGSEAATALLSTSSVMGLVKTLAAVGLAGLIGLITARLGSLSTGFAAASLTLCWAAWRSGRIDEILRRTQSASTFWTLAAESAILGVAGLLAAWAIIYSAPTPDTGGAAETKRESPWSTDGLTAAGLAVVVGGFSAMFIARSEMVGQTFAAALVAAMLGTTVGRVVRPNAPFIAFFIAGVALSILAPVAASFLHDQSLPSALNSGDLTPIARIMPLDWLAGMFMGVPLGAAWAKSFTDAPSEQMHTKPAPR